MSSTTIIHYQYRFHCACTLCTCYVDSDFECAAAAAAATISKFVMDGFLEVHNEVLLYCRCHCLH